MKKIMSLVLSIILSLSLSTYVYADGNDAYSAEIDHPEIEVYISKELRQNMSIMNELWGEEASNRYDSSSRAVIEISEDKETATISLEYAETKNVAVLKGDYNQVDVDGEIGYVAIYEGIFISIPNESFALDQEKMLPVIADITFSDSEMFAAITLGYATETAAPTILFYGEYSDKIAQFSNENARRALSNVEKVAIKKDNNEKELPLRVDALTRFKGYTSVYMGSYLAGRLSVFHANELKTQGNMSIFAKVNTNSSGVKDYIENDLGYGSLAVAAYPDKFNISICGNHNSFHAVQNSYEPQNNSTSATILIPVYLGQVLGVQTIPFNITMSSTTVTPSKYTSNSQYPNNRLSWSIYKRNGWNPGTFDGDYTTNTGMTVSSLYIYEDNVTGSLSRSITSTGSIRYEYWVMIMGNLSSYHVSTNTMSKTTYVTIIP